MTLRPSARLPHFCDQSDAYTVDVDACLRISQRNDHLPSLCCRIDLLEHLSDMDEISVTVSVGEHFHRVDSSGIVRLLCVEFLRLDSLQYWLSSENQAHLVFDKAAEFDQSLKYLVNFLFSSACSSLVYRKSLEESREHLDIDPTDFHDENQSHRREE